MNLFNTAINASTQINSDLTCKQPGILQKLFKGHASPPDNKLLYAKIFEAVRKLNPQEAEVLLRNLNVMKERHLLTSVQLENLSHKIRTLFSKTEGLTKTPGPARGISS